MKPLSSNPFFQCRFVKPPMSPYLLARDLPSLRQLVQRREWHAQVLRRFFDRHHFWMVFCHVLPRCFYVFGGEFIEVLPLQRKSVIEPGGFVSYSAERMSAPPFYEINISEKGRRCQRLCEIDNYSRLVGIYINAQRLDRLHGISNQRSAISNPQFATCISQPAIRNS